MFDDKSEKLDKVRDTAPTVASAAMLVEQTIGVWEGIRQDRKASTEVASLNNAQQGTVNVRKRLLGTCKELEAIRSFRNTCRKYHRENTLPWGHMGLRMLTNEQFFDYNEEVTGQQQRFATLVDEFLDVYDDEVTKAVNKLGSLFNRSDYPSVSTLKQWFRFSVNYVPLPSEGNFISDMFHQHADALNAGYEKYYEEQIEHAMQDIWQRLVPPLENMARMLDYDYSDTPTGFRDTLVSNVTNVAKLLKTCNIKKDPLMEEVHQELVSALRGVGPEQLRASASLRLETRANIRRIIDKLPSLDM